MNRDEAKHNPSQHSSSIRSLFNQVSPHYDLMNDLMSFALHRHWKNIAIDLGLLRSSHKILDLASGTGDLAIRIIKYLDNTGSLICVDPSEGMFGHGRDRMLDNGYLKNVNWCCASAENLPFQKHFFDRIFVGFGFRNFTDHLHSLKEMHRVLLPGGMALILEFSNIHSPLFKKLYSQYTKIIPKLGKCISQKENQYQYLIDSIAAVLMVSFLSEDECLSMSDLKALLKTLAG